MDERVCLEFDLSLIDPLLKPRLINNLPTDVENLVNLMQNGNYLEVFKLNLWILDKKDDASQPFHQSVCTAITEHLNDPASHLSLIQAYFVGISSLQLFVQRNWLGFLGNEAVNDFDFTLDEESIKELVLDGESLFPTVKSLPLLWIAKCVLHNFRESFPFKMVHWWHLRYLHVHQRVLEETSPKLNAAFLGFVDRSENLDVLLDDKTTLRSCLQMEIGYTYLLYGEVQKAKNCFEKASCIADFTVEWTGALGKRTRYQQTPLAQLTVRVHSGKLASPEGAEEFIPAADLPSDVKLDDDTRLNRIAFVNQNDDVLPDLPPLHQALLISEATQLEKCHAKDELLAEEVSPLLSCVLAYPKIWSLNVSSLLIRSKLESTQRRAVERSMTQLQELVDCLSKASPAPHRRLEYFYVSRMPSEWELEGSLADVFVSLGAVSSALDLYLRLQMWEKVIGCYQHLELRHRAEEIVRQELAKKETPKLWCLLGDCTDDIQCYEKAWEVSNHTSARAQRDWAYFFYRKKQYRECIPHFQESLAINSLQESTWIRLAFSAMEVEDWETAAGAYRRYCSLNSDSFEAWNNVAKCYVKLGQKARAWKALQEAVKCQYENWKVWDNLMVVSVDCCEYEEVIRSYHRILDLKEKHVDIQVLKIIVQALSENKEDNYGQPVVRLVTLVQKLFGRLTSQVMTNAELWEVYSDLIACTEKDSPFRVAQMMQKALRSAVQEKSWEKDPQTCVTTLKTCAKFIYSCLNMLEKDSSKENLQLAASAKLSLRSVLSQVRLCYPMEVPECIKEQLDLLEKLQSDLVTLISNAH